MRNNRFIYKFLIIPVLLFFLLLDAVDNRGQSAAEDPYIISSPDIYQTGLIFQNPELDPSGMEVYRISPLSLMKTYRAEEISSHFNYEYLPPVNSQGSQGSCVAWAIGYYYKTYQENQEIGRTDIGDKSLPQNICSPAFIYNLIHIKGENGAYFSDGFRVVNDFGCASLLDMPYDENDYQTWPDENDFLNAIPRKTQSSSGEYYWLSMNSDAILDQIKQRLINGNLVVFGINVYDNFYYIHNFNYNYTVADRYGSNHGGHAQTIVGFDDNRITNDGVGAFRVINSWGTGWGDSGFYWISYQAIKAGSSISHGYAYWVDDRIGYNSDQKIIFEFSHQYSRETNTWFQVSGSSLNFFDFYVRTRDPEYFSFPNSNIVLDVKDLESYISPGSELQLYMEDTNENLEGGIIEYFAYQNDTEGYSLTSTDPPVTVPDQNSAYAHILIPSGPAPPEFINYPSLDCDGYYSITWSTVAGATGYELQRATLYDFSDSATIYSGLLTFFDETGILIGTYYYRVRAMDGSGYGAWREGGGIIVSSSPGSFSYLSPANSSTDVPLITELDWSDSSQATSYDVYFGTNNPPPKLTTVTESIYSPSLLNENTTYYWKVVAKNACGEVSGEIWSFTTGESNWERINYNNSSQAIGGNQDTNLIDEVTSDFGALGLWTYYNNNNWQRLNFKDPQCLALGDIDQDGKEEIIVGFSGLGIWVYDSSDGWRRISWNTPQAIMCGDLDGNGKDEVVIDSGTSGIWSYDNNSSWRKLNNGNPDCMACGDINNDGLDELIAGFGSSGVWAYNTDTDWQKIDGRNVENMVCGDLDNNGYDEVIGDFGSLGILVYLNNSTWGSINSNNSNALTCGDFDNDGKEEIGVSFPSLGIWIFHYPGSWYRVNWNSVGDLCCGDLDNNGSLELIGDFNNYGLWAYYYIQ